MHVIVCLDDRDGMLFNRRRLSSDRLLCQRILENAQEGRLWMNSYSAALFPQGDILVDENFMEKAEPEDLCFVENTDLIPYLDRITAVTVYRWNRAYPADRKFPTERFDGRWTLIESTDFPGNSHETITEQRYVL